MELDSMINAGVDYDSSNDRMLVLGHVTTTLKGKRAEVAGVKVLDRDGNFIFDFSLVKDHDTYALSQPHQIAYDRTHGRIIAVGIDSRVYIFDKNGEYIYKFSIPKYGSEQYIYAGAILPGARLIRVWDVAYDHNNDRIITADTWIPGYSNVQVLNSNGERLLRLAPPGRTEFEPLMSVAYDHNHDRIMVADASNRIFIFDKDGRFITSLGNKGNKVLEFNNIQDIAYDPNNDRIIVADHGNERVQVLTLVRDTGSSNNTEYQHYALLLTISIVVAVTLSSMIYYLKKHLLTSSHNLTK
ncbi:MAG: NHL repeat-containing protein [Candidatus Nitrosocaldus sp.]|nr:NHL repeat-containing protein [Candidatus Nitrosocaldus sp.]